MKKLLTMLIVTMAATTVFAAEPGPDKKKEPTQAEVKQAIEASVGALVPMIAKMTEASIFVQLKIAELPETAKSLATFKKNLYEELVKQGFSKKEAFDIMLNTSMPAATPGMK